MGARVSTGVVERIERGRELMGKLDAAYRRNGQGASRLSHPVARSRAIGDDGEERERMDSSNGPGRTLHLVDIENLVGAPTTWTDQRVRTVFEQFLQGASWTPGDSLVVASNPNLMGRLMFWQIGRASCRERV